MTAYEATLAERKRQRRIARRIEAFVVTVVIGSALAVILLYHPGNASAGPPRVNQAMLRASVPTARIAGAYVHLDACKSSLRGGGGSDDDVHVYGVQTGATSFIGWSATYTRVSATDLYVYGWLRYPSSSSRYPQQQYRGRCWGNDYSSDAFPA